MGIRPAADLCSAEGVWATTRVAWFVGADWILPSVWHTTTAPSYVAPSWRHSFVMLGCCHRSCRRWPRHQVFGRSLGHWPCMCYRPRCRHRPARPSFPHRSWGRFSSWPLLATSLRYVGLTIWAIVTWKCRYFKSKYGSISSICRL